MYIEIVRAALEEAVELYSVATGLTVPEVLSRVKEQIENTAREHRVDEPAIEYEDPLCRLGYLYRHATANATLFERVLIDSGKLRQILRGARQRSLQICSVGGGPGTELLGLAKYLIRKSEGYPRKISFAVLDNVPQWADTWYQLADAVEQELTVRLSEEKQDSPVIAANFLQFDVLDEQTYKQYLHAFRKIDIFVFNYVFSENKTRLADATDAIKHLKDVTPSGCTFVVIDRLERDGRFSENVAQAFVDAGFDAPKVHSLTGILDNDEQTRDMGEMFKSVLGSPRTKFFTDGYRDPTVFWFETTK